MDILTIRWKVSNHALKVLSVEHQKMMDIFHLWAVINRAVFVWFLA